MNTDLETHVIGFGNKTVQLIHRMKRQATIFDVVGVGCQQCGTATAQRAIGIQFDRPDIEPVPAIAHNRLAYRVEIAAGATEHGIDAHIELVIVSHRHIDFGLDNVDACVVYARHAE